MRNRLALIENFKMIGAAILCYLLAALPNSEQAHPKLSAGGDKKLHVYALPVGQGDGTVIQCPNGDVTIVDLGSSTRTYNEDYHGRTFQGTYMTNDELNAFLGNTNIKYFFITHADIDHYNMFVNIHADRLKSVIGAYAGCTAKDYTTVNMQQWLQKYKVTYNPPLDTVVNICPGVHIKVLAINTDVFNPGCSNENSMVLRLEYGTFSLLLPGDLEDYDGFQYNANGVITSNLKTESGLLTFGKPGVLKTVSDRSQGGIKLIKSTVYRLSHHGAWPRANKPFFLEAIAPHYVFSSSQLPGTGKFYHPICGLYYAMVNMANKGQLPIEKYPKNTAPQINYFCGEDKGRDKEDENTYGIFTTAAFDVNKGGLVNYFIQIDSDGTNHHVTPQLWR